MIARVACLGERSDRRVWLCIPCHERYRDHELEPEELLKLTKRAARRAGKCDWCAEAPPAAQVRVPLADGAIFAFQLCASCAREAHQSAGGQVLHAQAALAGDVTVDPRYEKALEVMRRRREIRRVK